MKVSATILCCIISLKLCIALPGDYSSASFGGDYVADIGPAYQTLSDQPALLSSTADLKPASTYDIEYGSPEPIVPFIPFRSFGWGWKQPQPFIAPFPIIHKPFPFPIIPLGWGWQNPGIF